MHDGILKEPVAALLVLLKACINQNKDNSTKKKTNMIFQKNKTNKIKQLNLPFCVFHLKWVKMNL